MSLHRREVLIGGLLTVVWLANEEHCHAQGQRIEKAPGCIIRDASVARRLVSGQTVLRLSGNEPVIAKSGDALFDRALAETLLMLTNAFNALPDFGYVREWEKNERGQVVSNAVAVPTSVRPSRNPDGTVLFGTRLFAELRALREHPEVAVTAVCAHEWGHILQFKRNLTGRLLENSRTVKPVELHADFLAGYFAGMRRRQKADYPAAVVALTQYNIGDNEFQSPDHHGTSRERGDAVAAGFQVAYRDQKSIDEAVEIGIRMARSNM